MTLFVLYAVGTGLLALVLTGLVTAQWVARRLSTPPDLPPRAALPRLEGTSTS